LLLNARLSVSRVLFVPKIETANHLSSSLVAQRLKRILDDELWREPSASWRIESISLQQTGFTSFTSRLAKLRAFTSLVSPFPPVHSTGKLKTHKAIKLEVIYIQLYTLFTLNSLVLCANGSFVSVALSLGLPPVAVSNCLSLRCPDFPLAPQGDKRSANNLACLLYT
jgi:hypothetical protein